MMRRLKLCLIVIVCILAIAATLFVKSGGLNWINDHCYKNHATAETIAKNSGPLCR